MNVNTGCISARFEREYTMKKSKNVGQLAQAIYQEKAAKAKKGDKIAEAAAAKRAAEKERRIVGAKLAADAREALAKAAKGLATKESKPDLEKTESKPPVETKKKKPAAEPKVGKGATIVALLQRTGGATSEELMKASGWQRHSLRGFISAVVGKKMGLKVSTAKNEAGEFTYQIAK